MVTEPVPIMEGEVIAEGTGSQLGGAPVDHIAFIVRTIRDHLWGAQCDHADALWNCWRTCAMSRMWLGSSAALMALLRGTLTAIVTMTATTLRPSAAAIQGSAGTLVRPMRS